MQVKAGFTLMELMVAVACASVLALAVIGSYSGYATYRKVHARYTESYGRMSVELLQELHEKTKNARFGGRFENRF